MLLMIIYVQSFIYTSIQYLLFYPLQILKDYLELFQPYLGDSSLTLNVLPVFSHVASAHPIAITQFRHSIVNFVKWEPSVLCQVVTIMGSLASVSKVGSVVECYF